MKYVWTWSGTFFGYIDNEDLWSYNGKHVGKIYDIEIYDRNGKYIGEIKQKNRLITNLNKKTKRNRLFTPYVNRVRQAPHVDYVGYAMLAGYTDFPNPNTFEK